jgi:hypothetical protein
MLPGMRSPLPSDERFVPAGVNADAAGGRADAIDPARRASAAPVGTSPEAVPAVGPGRECEAALRLPWGPIESCRSAVVGGTLAAGGTLSMLAWWSQGFTSRFSVAHEGWFGKGTYAGGIDKLGHAYSFYVATRLGTRALTWARLPPAEALGLAAGLSLGVGLGIEVLDGLSRGGRYGFSREDMAMNLVGTGLGVLMESHPELDRYLAFRLMYSPGGREDSWYDHQLYLLAFRLSGLSAIGPANPLRYVELVAGYGAKGFRSDLDYSVDDHRRRSAYVGIALNLTELLERTAFAGDARHGVAHRWTTEALRYLQPPGTVVAARHRWRP